MQAVDFAAGVDAHLLIGGGGDVGQQWIGMVVRLVDPSTLIDIGLNIVLVLSHLDRACEAEFATSTAVANIRSENRVDRSGPEEITDRIANSIG